jgi:SAM-dependent methyltransferase
MDMESWQRNWDALGLDDPLWVILTDPSKKGGKWDQTEWFQRGRDDIAAILSQLPDLGVAVRRGRALDFGCGAGRLSQALAEHFDEVDGVDISPSMVAHANRLNTFGGRCRYHVNCRGDLELFVDGHFDFILSLITLQHIEPNYTKEYVREFVRVLKPGGILYFQVLTPAFWRSLVPDLAVNMYRRLRHGHHAFIGMFGVSKREMDDVIARAGGRVVHFETRAFESPRWRSMYYVVRR